MNFNLSILLVKSKYTNYVQLIHVYGSSVTDHLVNYTVLLLLPLLF